MPKTKIVEDVFTFDDLYDQDVVQEAHQLDTLLVDVIDAVPRYEAAVLIALAKRFVSVCDQADIDPEAAFAQIAEGVEAEQFEAAHDGYVHEAHSTIQ